MPKRQPRKGKGIVAKSHMEFVQEFLPSRAQEMGLRRESDSSAEFSAGELQALRKLRNTVRATAKSRSK